MYRRWIAGLIGLALAGCASPGGGTSRREVPSGENSPFDDFAPIHQTINNGTARTTEVAKALEAPKHAVGAVSDLDPKATQASVAPPQPESKFLAIPGPAGRPAPFAAQTEREPRPQGAPVDGPSERSAPFAEAQPTAPRPQVSPAISQDPRPTIGSPPVALPPTTSATPEPTPPPALPAPPNLSAAAPAQPPSFDQSVIATSGVPPLLAPPRKRSELDNFDRPAARVGEEIITVHQLRAAVAEKLEQIPPQERTLQIQKMVVDRILENLIDRALILQAAKRQFKDPKNLKAFHDMIEKVWLEHEIPPLLKVHNAKNVYELKVKLAEKGKSYDELHEEFRSNTLAQEFIGMKMKEKLTVSLPEMWSYYDKHLKDYDRPAQMIWREISIDLSKHPTRAAAKQKADQILARLRKGADFAELAKKESDGATAAQGGRWETTPGSYGVDSVNAFLDRMPINQLSPIVEAPSAFHIVRVEQRRPAGPARFDEVQDAVKQAVSESKRKDAAAKYVSSLREKAIITTMFDTPPSDPATIRVKAEAPAPSVTR